MELSVAEIKQRIYSIRGHQVVLDKDLAEYYQTETRLLNRAVQRNIDRFPQDFRFRLTKEEHETLKSQACFLDPKRGGRRYIPYAYTEHGVAMLSSVLGNSRAVQINIMIMRSFAQAKQVSQIEMDSKRLHQIESKLEQLEQKYDDQFKMLLQGVQQILVTKSGNYLPGSGEFKSFASHSQNRDALTPSQADSIGAGSLFLGKELRLKTEAIHLAVAKYFGLKVRDLKGGTRVRAVVLPRQIAIYLVRRHVGSSFKEIGSTLGLNDPTSAMHGYKKVAAAVEKDGAVKEAVFSIQNSLA